MNYPAESTPKAYRSYFLAVVVLVLGLLVYLWGHVKTMRQGEELIRLRSEREALIHRQDRLRVEVAGLQHSVRIRSIAAEKLGMVFPSEPPRNLYLQTPAGAKSGRVKPDAD
ncbi:MAG: cell division protein FtsL [Candidatus Latescibacteria bacterium]|jgi:cell division protein FtsL|nr:cell division protein FtsL [Candidatus Latescibacterota bacterium]